MIHNISKTNKSNLIIFVHGFTGGTETWVKKGAEKIPDLLLKNPKITENFDLVQFDYFTKVSIKFELFKYVLSKIPFVRSRISKKNLPIEDLTDILCSHLKAEFRNYEKVVIVAHSMGGLISKAAILKLIKEDLNQVVLFLSLCVPHNGSKLADLGKLFLSNPNLIDLAPLSKITDNITREWIDNKYIELLPDTVYFQGKFDGVVANESSAGYDTRNSHIVYSEDDHSSILTPKNEDVITMKEITNALLDSLKKKAKSEKPVITADISAKSLQDIASKISSKLGLHEITLGILSLDKDEIPPLAAHISKRKETVENILQHSGKTLIAINGLYQSGKTQIAVLIQQYLNIPTTWITFDQESEDSFLAKILRAYDSENLHELKSKIELINDLSKRLIVLDNLPKFSGSRKIENFLVSFISSCSGKNILILSTSNHSLSYSLQTVLGDQIHEEILPSLSREETDEILSTYPESSAFEFTDLLHDVSSGHPLYFQVMCRFLQNKKWSIDKNELQGFLSGSVFSELTDQTLNTFIEKVENDETRNLLYRLNIIKTQITEKEIKIVSDCSPLIELPFEKINPALGTWLQRKANQYFFSPLLKRLGTANISKDLFSEASYKLALGLLEKKNLSQHDVKNLISYFKDAEKFDNAGFATLNLLQFCHSNPNFYYENNLGIYTWYYEILPTKMSLFLRLNIRTLQLHMALGKKEDNNAIVDFLRNDLVELTDMALVAKLDASLAALILSSSYMRNESQLAIKYFTHYINSPNYDKSFGLALPEAEELTSVDSSLSWLLLMEINDIKELEKWFKNSSKINHFNDTPVTEQAFLLSEKLLQNFVSQEEGLAAPDWKNLLDKFRDIYKLAELYNIPILSTFALKYQIKILSEKLDDIHAAEGIYLGSSFPKDELGQYLLTDEIGRQMFFKEKKEKAQKYLQKIENYAAEKYIYSKADTLYILSRIAADTDIQLAHLYIKQALDFTQNNVFVAELNYIKYIGEFATSLYNIGEKQLSIREFIKGYELLLESFEDNSSFFNTQVKFGNAIGYLERLIIEGTSPGNTHTEPYRGMFINFNELTDQYFSEKVQLVIFIIIGFYEKQNEMRDSQKWAQKLFDLKKKFDIKIFQRSITPLLGYPISQGHYQFAAEQLLEIRDSTTEILQKDTAVIEKEAEKKITEKIKSFEIDAPKDHDFDTVVNLIAPVLFHLLTKYLKKEINHDQVIYTIKNLTDQYSSAFTDGKSKIYLQELISKSPTDSESAKEFLNELQTIEKPYSDRLELIAYLISSIVAEPKDALYLHLVLSHCFLLYTGSIDNLIIIPFLLEFWKSRMSSSPKSFKNIAKLNENLEKIKNFSFEHQIPAIFALMADDLGYIIPSKFEPFMEKYYDKYGA